MGHAHDLFIETKFRMVREGICVRASTKIPLPTPRSPGQGFEVHGCWPNMHVPEREVSNWRRQNNQNDGF